MLNPNTQDSPSIMIQYKEYSSKPVVFPILDTVLEVAAKEMESVSVKVIVVDKYCKYLVIFCLVCSSTGSSKAL